MLTTIINTIKNMSRNKEMPLDDLLRKSYKRGEIIDALEHLGFNLIDSNHFTYADRLKYVNKDGEIIEYNLLTNQLSYKYDSDMNVGNVLFEILNQAKEKNLTHVTERYAIRIAYLFQIEYIRKHGKVAFSEEFLPFMTGPALANYRASSGWFMNDVFFDAGMRKVLERFDVKGNMLNEDKEIIGNLLTQFSNVSSVQLGDGILLEEPVFKHTREIGRATVSNALLVDHYTSGGVHNVASI